MVASHPSRRRWRHTLVTLVLAGGGLFAGTAAAPNGTLAGVSRLAGPGNPLPLATVVPVDRLPAACLAGPASPPAFTGGAASMLPLDPLAHTRWLRLPVLMYHYVEPPAPGLSLVERGLTMTPEAFAAQMRYLHERGYVTVSLYDLASALRTGRALPPRAVVLTFDGGHRALLRYALPTLQAYGYTGTIFAITKGMDDGQALYLTWDEARDLYRQGWSIEPHTRTHLPLAGHSAAQQWAELCGSMLDVAEHIGAVPRFIAYPSGLYDATTLRLAQLLGFWGGVTTRINRWQSLGNEFTLPRVRVNATETLRQFMTSVDGDLK